MTVIYPPNITPAELTPSIAIEVPGRLSLVETKTATPDPIPDPAAEAADPAILRASVVNLTAHALLQPEVRTAKVQQLRAQIAAGAYSVDASRVAEAMLADPLTNLKG